MGTLATSVRQQVMTCPSCDKPIMAELALRAEQPDGSLTGAAGKEVRLTATLVGVKVDHDCLPKATRSSTPRKPRQPAGHTPVPAVEDEPGPLPAPASALAEAHRNQLKARRG